MIDTTATAQLPMRARLIATTVCTTGSTTLSATTTGYARASGSFVTDGFSVGMEVTASGFSTAGNNGTGVITMVSALAMSVTKTALSTTTDGKPTIIAGTATATEAAAAARTILARPPQLRAYDNVPVVPTVGSPYLEEDFIPATNTLRSFPANGGVVEETGLYVLKIFGISGTGISSIRKVVNVIKAQFSSGTTFSSGVVRVRNDPGPYAGQITPIDGGWSYVVLTIPWRATSTNAVAA